MEATKTQIETTKTEIELYVINKVKELRKAAKLSQEKLSLELKLDSSFADTQKDYLEKKNVICIILTKL